MKLKWERIFAVDANGWIAVFTAVLTVTSIAQWCTMNETLKISERAYVGIQSLTADLMNGSHGYLIPEHWQHAR